MLKPIPINQGSFQNVDELEHGDAGTAHVFKNMLINDAGSNVARPGLVELIDLGDEPVIGMEFFSNKIVAVTRDRNIYSISRDGSYTDITGTALEGGSRPRFASDGTYLAIAGGGAPRRWDGNVNTELMPGSPPDCAYISYLDGYFVLNLINDQEFRWAGPTPAARESWSSANFFAAEGLPDNTLTHTIFNREVYSFGTDSVEVFFNYGDTGVPMKRTFFMDTGCGAPNSVVQADNTLWWLDNNRRIVTMSQRTPIFISSPFDRVIKEFETVSDCFGYKIDIEGFYLIVWVFPSEGRTFCYDYKNKYWSEWDGFENGLSSIMRMNSYVFASRWNEHFVSDPENGKIYRLTNSVKTDGDYVKRLIRRTGQIDHGSGIRKRSNKYLFHVKRGVGTPGETEPLMQIRVKDDGGEWSEPEMVGLGFPGEPQEPIEVHIGGIYRKRQLEIQVTDSVDFVLNKLEEDLQGMTS